MIAKTQNVLIMKKLYQNIKSKKHLINITNSISKEDCVHQNKDIIQDVVRKTQNDVISFIVLYNLKEIDEKIHENNISSVGKTTIYYVVVNPISFWLQLTYNILELNFVY